MFTSSWRRWTGKKLGATVIDDIWPEVFFFTLVAAMVSIVSSETSHSLAISNQLLTVLGTVLGLVVSFRTSSAYERYQDGRKLWTNITIASRNLGYLIWIHVPTDRTEKPAFKNLPTVNFVIEKKSMVNLVQAWSVAVKHFLRGEPGIYYQDLYPLVCYLPKFASDHHNHQTHDDILPLWRASEDYGQSKTSSPPTAPAAHSVKQTSSLPTLHPTPGSPEPDGGKHTSPLPSSSKSRRRNTFDPEKALPVVDSDRPLRPARNPPPSTIYDYIPLFRIFKPIVRLFRPPGPDDRHRTLFGRKKKPPVIDSNVPLEITLFLSSYHAWLMQNGLLSPAVATAMTNNVATLQDTMTNLERIRNTPLPFAYQAHLRMSMWLYLFFLPFQIFSAFKYLTIPTTAFASFLLLGFLEIGQEIENPFNYDDNDLDLDGFCLAIQRELHEITAHTCPNPDEFIFGAWNQPFAPGDRRTAAEIVKQGDMYAYGDGLEDEEGEETEKGLPSIRRTLLKSWREVEKLTRH